MIFCLDDLKSHLGRDVQKAVSTSTECGAWIESHLDKIELGSVIEGVEFGTEVQTLLYPFSIDSFYDALSKVEKEAKVIWNDTHGCDDCGSTDRETGYIPVNPNCLVCNGEGLPL